MITTFLAGIAVSISLLALKAASRTTTTIKVYAEPIPEEPKGPSLPPFIEQPQSIPTEKYSLSNDYGGPN